MPTKTSLEPVNLSSEANPTNINKYVCPAHPYLEKELQNTSKEIKDLNERLDPIVDYVTGKKAIDEWWTIWKNRIYGVIGTIIAGIILYSILYLTPL